jgi:hypothetical protein
LKLPKFTEYDLFVENPPVKIFDHDVPPFAEYNIEFSAELPYPDATHIPDGTIPA